MKQVADERDESVAEDADDATAVAAAAETRRRLGTVFGWLAGGALGVLVNYGLLRVIGEGYPTTYTTFGFFLAGAFGGMALSDRLGPRGFKPLGIAAGVLLALIIALVLALFTSSPTS